MAQHQGSTYKRTSRYSLSPHSRLYFHNLVRTSNNPDGHFPSSCLLLLQVVVDPIFNVRPKSCGWQPLGAIPILFPLGTSCFMAIITGEPLWPDGVIVQHTDLVELPAALTAFHKRLQLQGIILHLDELVLANHTVGIRRRNTCNWQNYMCIFIRGERGTTYVWGWEGSSPRVTVSP